MMMATPVGDACSEERTEPDVNLILEICELVKSKTAQYVGGIRQAAAPLNTVDHCSAHLAASTLSEYFAKEDKVQTMIALFVLGPCRTLPP